MFYRLVKMSNKWMGIETNDLADDLENIEEFARNGEIVVIVDDLETFCDEMGLELDEVVIVD